jgi:hypothetical protein
VGIAELLDRTVSPARCRAGSRVRGDVTLLSVFGTWLGLTLRFVA